MKDVIKRFLTLSPEERRLLAEGLEERVNLREKKFIENRKKNEITSEFLNREYK